MRKTLTVKSKRSSILDVTEDDTCLKLTYTPEIRIKSGSESSSAIEENKFKGRNRSESFSKNEFVTSSRNSSRRSSVSVSFDTIGNSSEPKLSRSSSLSSLVTNANFHVRKGISTSTNLSRG